MGVRGIMESFSTIRALCLALCLASPIARAQTTHSTTANPTNKKTTPANSEAEAIETVDSYLSQILCSNIEFKVWKEGLYRASKAPLSESVMRKVFSENLFYSLMPGQERQEFKTAIPGIFSNVEKLTGELSDVAVFFSSTMHELFEQENKKLTDAGKPPISKEDFIEEFGKGSLVLKKDGSDYKAWINEKIQGIEKLTEELRYGCAGNRNFIYRANSRLGSVIDLDSFVIPATNKSAKKLAEITENATTSPTHEKTRASQPRAAVLGDNKQETKERAEEIYKPSTKPRVVRSQEMVGATFYFTPIETDPRYRGSKTYRVFDDQGRVIARVSESFYNELKVQGSGILADGRTINFIRIRGGVRRFKETESKYGLGKSDNPLKPWRSIAIDFNYYRRRGIKLEIGQQIYIPSTHGLKIPGTNQYHDGIWELADVGGAINGPRIDMFTGTMHWKDSLAYVNKSSNYNDNKRNSEANLLGDRRRQVTMKILR